VLRAGVMSGRPYNVLFLCTGNSARSILAEALLNRDGEGRFRAYSAGSFPKGEVHPMALRLLSELGFETDGLRSKSWDEFAAPGAPELDFIFTVCDEAAGEVCPIWPGQPVTAHWGIDDPARVDGEDQRQAFVTAMAYLRNRIALFLALPIETIDGMSLHHRLEEIGRSERGTSKGQSE
jgi:arsenate reductase